jgi:hypothetical protein
MSAFDILRPTLQSLSAEEPSLVSLANSVYETLHASKGDKIAHNAARMYLAMIAGFEQAGLMTSSCAPSIWVQTPAGNYEVRFRVTSLVSRSTQKLTLPLRRACLVKICLSPEQDDDGSDGNNSDRNSSEMELDEVERQSQAHVSTHFVSLQK